MPVIARSIGADRKGRSPGGPGIKARSGRVSVVQAWPAYCCAEAFGLGLAGKEWHGDHVGEKRCSGLDLLGCEPRPGYAARGINRRESAVAYGSLRLRDGVRAMSSSSRWWLRMLGAPPRTAPARVIPGLTLWESEGWVGSRISPQLQRTSLFGDGALPESLSLCPWYLGGPPHLTLQ